MEINTTKDAEQFCRQVQGHKGLSFRLLMRDNATLEEVTEAEKANNKARLSGIKIPSSSVLQSGIEDVYYNGDTAVVVEKPFLVPTEASLRDHKDLTGPTISVVANCYDPENQLMLLQISGAFTKVPDTIQNIGSTGSTSREQPNASMFRQHPSATARKALEKAGILYAKSLALGNPLGVYSCPIKVGNREIPHLVFGFGFENDLSRVIYLNCNSSKEVEAYREQVKDEKSGRESYSFTIPLSKAPSILKYLQKEKALNGPVYESLTDFLAVIKSSEVKEARDARILGK